MEYNPYWPFIEALRNEGLDPVSATKTVVALVYLLSSAGEHLDLDAWLADVHPQNLRQKLEELVLEHRKHIGSEAVDELGARAWLLEDSLRTLETSRNGGLWLQIIERIRAVEGIPLAPMALDALIARAYAQAGARGGFVYTPKPLATLMVHLLQVSGGLSIYDPTCGTGGLLALAHDFADPEDDEVHLYGQDLDTAAVAIAAMRLSRHEARNVHLKVGNTLFSPGFTGDDRLQVFDRVIANLPWGVRSRWQHEQLDRLPPAFLPYGPPGAILDLAFVQHAAASLNETGRAVVTLIPGSLIRGGADAGIRARLIEHDLVECVISLPAGAFSYTRVSPVLLVLNRNKPASLRGKVLFIEASLEARELTEELTQHIRTLTQNPETTRRASALVSSETVLANNAALAPSLYVDFVDLTTFMGGQSKTVILGEVAEVLQGSPLVNDSVTEPVIRPRDLLEGAILVDQLERGSISGTEEPVRCEPGDVLLNRLGASPRVALAGEELQGIAVSRDTRSL